MFFKIELLNSATNVLTHMNNAEIRARTCHDRQTRSSDAVDLAVLLFDTSLPVSCR
jgi:hypothetical protein